MSITAPSNFTCNKTSAYSGEALTFTWAAATGDFNRYRFYGSGNNGFTPSVYPSASATSLTTTFPEEPVGSTVVYSLLAQKGTGAGDGFSDQSESVNFTVACIAKPALSAPPAPDSISVGNVAAGKDIAISWGTSSSTGTPSYALQRSVDGGAFQTVYTGSALSYTDSAGADWATVQYRVRATVSGMDSDWTTSAVKSVTTSDPPAIFATLITPLTQGKEFTASWTSSVAGEYTFQQSINGGEFETVYIGEKTAYSGIAGTGWVTARFRVRVSANGETSKWGIFGETPVASGITLPPGGRLEQLENRDAKPVFPLTVTEGVFRQSDGKSLDRILREVGSGAGSPEGASVPAGGAAGQILAKRSSSDYDTEWIDAPSSGGATEPSTGGVTSFKGRTGAVTPQSGDYTAAQVGAVPTSRKVNGQALSGDITLITCGTADLTAGSSPLAAGTLYGVYEV